VSATISNATNDLRERATKLALWNAFCKAHRIADTGVSLFAGDRSGNVEVFAYGRDGRPMLRRSPEMHNLLASTVGQVIASPPEKAEGVLYIMHYLNFADQVVPLYVGKAGRFGRIGGLSANLAGMGTNDSKFARWGYNYAYHLGDLSAAALPGHGPGRVIPKYQRWAARLFVETPVAQPRLREPVRFWCTSWGPGSRNIWSEFGSCPLAFAEYLLIGVAGLLFPDT
jgi:hypothetical protein